MMGTSDEQITVICGGDHIRRKWGQSGGRMTSLGRPISKKSVHTLQELKPDLIRELL